MRFRRFRKSEERDRELNPYWEGFRNDDIAEDDYSEESDANSVYIERRGY